MYDMIKSTQDCIDSFKEASKLLHGKDISHKLTEMLPDMITHFEDIKKQLVISKELQEKIFDQIDVISENNDICRGEQISIAFNALAVVVAQFLDLANTEHFSTGFHLNGVDSWNAFKKIVIVHCKENLNLEIEKEI